MPRSRRYSDSHGSQRPRFDDAPVQRGSRRYNDDSYTRSRSVGHHRDDRPRPRYDGYDDDRLHGRSGGSRHRSSRSEERWDDKIDKDKFSQAVKAGLTAGAVEAWRQRKSRSGWSGEKGARVATAAISAAALDAIVDKNPGRKKKRHIGEATIGGLMIDRLLNGPRK